VERLYRSGQQPFPRRGPKINSAGYGGPYCRVWWAVLTGRAVLIFYEPFRSFAVYDVAKTWELMKFQSDQTPDFTVYSENPTYI